METRIKVRTINCFDLPKKKKTGKLKQLYANRKQDSMLPKHTDKPETVHMKLIEQSSCPKPEIGIAR